MKRFNAFFAILLALSFVVPCSTRRGQAQAVEPIIVAVVLTQIFVFGKLLIIDDKFIKEDKEMKIRLTKNSLDFFTDWNYRVTDADQKNVSNVFKTEADAQDFMEKVIHKKWQARREAAGKASVD